MLHPFTNYLNVFTYAGRNTFFFLFVKVFHVRNTHEHHICSMGFWMFLFSEQSQCGLCTYTKNWCYARHLMWWHDKHIYGYESTLFFVNRFKINRLCSVFFLIMLYFYRTIRTSGKSRSIISWNKNVLYFYNSESFLKWLFTFVFYDWCMHILLNILSTYIPYILESKHTKI